MTSFQPFNSNNLNAKNTAAPSNIKALLKQIELPETFKLEYEITTEPEPFELGFEEYHGQIEDSHQQIELVFYETSQQSNTDQYELAHMPTPLLYLSFTHSDDVLKFQHATSLLEALEQQGINLPYQCRSGYCGACRTQIISGEVAYLQEPLAWLHKGETLPCCCVPKTDLTLKLKG